jgi:hypothetical protein
MFIYNPHGKVTKRATFFKRKLIHAARKQIFSKPIKPTQKYLRIFFALWFLFLENKTFNAC